MTDQELKDLVASLAVKSDRLDAQIANTNEQLAKTDAQIAKTDAQLSKTDTKLDKIASMVGGISNNQGDVAEEFFYNSLGDKPVVGGISFDSISKNISVRKAGKHAEFDIVLENGSSMAVVEVKYKVHPSDLDKVLAQMKSYREFFPAYKDYKLYGGIAGFSVSDDVTEKAHEHGLFVLKRKGEVIEMDAQTMRAF